jgi:DNA polymerase-1
MKEKFVIVDGNALVHRAYHAITSLISPQGQPVNAVYGFFLILFSALKEIDPKYIIVTFDVAKKTFRHEVFKDYKANRQRQPDNLYEQIPLIKEILKTLSIPIFEQEGYEAAEEAEEEFTLTQSDVDNFDQKEIRSSFNPNDEDGE